AHASAAAGGGPDPSCNRRVLDAERMAARPAARGGRPRLLGRAGTWRARPVRAWHRQAAPRLYGDLRGPGVAGKPGGRPVAGPISAAARRAPDGRPRGPAGRGAARRPGVHPLVGPRRALLVLLAVLRAGPEHARPGADLE